MTNPRTWTVWHEGRNHADKAFPKRPIKVVEKVAYDLKCKQLEVVLSDLEDLAVWDYPVELRGDHMGQVNWASRKCFALIKRIQEMEGE